MKRTSEVVWSWDEISTKRRLSVFSRLTKKPGSLSW
jgi:hypothetical protein